MHRLNLPHFDFKVKKQNENVFIFDNIRRKFVRLTPEEWVRQHFIHYLINEKRVPPGLISVEKGLKINRLPHRSDIVVYNRVGVPWMLIECKSPEVALSHDALDQAGRYNLSLKVKYLVITNGLDHHVFHLDNDKGIFEMLNEIPEFY